MLGQVVNFGLIIFQLFIRRLRSRTSVFYICVGCVLIILPQGALGCQIGFRAGIVPGVELGKLAFIAAGRLDDFFDAFVFDFITLFDVGDLLLNRVFAFTGSFERGIIPGHFFGGGFPCLLQADNASVQRFRRFGTGGVQLLAVFRDGGFSGAEQFHHRNDRAERTEQAGFQHGTGDWRLRRDFPQGHV